MKTLLVFTTTLLLVLPQLLGADAASARLQQGLFEEEANHNLEAAMTAYQSILTAHEDERKLAATALFRLGECYRKLGRTNEAVAQYQRLLRDFAEQENLTRLSEQNLFALGKAGRVVPGTAASAGSLRPRPSPRERSLIEEQIALTEKQLATTKKMIETGVTSVDSDIPYRQALTRLRHQLALLDTPAGGPQERKWLEEDIALQEKVVKRAKGLIESGLAAVGSEIEPQKELLALKRELAALESSAGARAAEGGSTANANDASPGGTGPKPDAQEVEIRRLETIIKDSPDLINAPGDPPLQRAVGFSQDRVVAYLLDHGAEVDMTDRTARAALHLAADMGDRAMVALLLDHKANVNLRWRSYSSTPLMLAAAKGFKSVVELLLARGADVSAADSQGRTALHLAAEGNKREVAEVLLANKADINARSRDEFTPLGTAVVYGQGGFVKMLLSRGALVDPKQPNGRTPLVDAVGRNDEATVEQLLSHRADPNVRFAGKLVFMPEEPSDGGGRNQEVAVQELTPLMLSAHEGSVPIARRLLKAGADINAQDGRGYTALHWAVKRDRHGTIQLLLGSGAAVNAQDKSGASALATAASLGRETVVRMLLDQGALPDLPAGRGYPLHAAVRYYHKAVIELLLDRGADLSAADASGQTALDLAKAGTSQPTERGRNRPTISRPELVALLRKHGANEYVPRTGLITLCRVSRSFSQPRFFKGTNDYNRHTLLELIAQAYSEEGGMPRHSPNLAFPDLANIRISRWEPSVGKVREIKVDLDSILGPGGQGRDVGLEWGDVIEIPEVDHRATDSWPGFPWGYAKRIDELLSRQIEIRIKGETNRVTLRPPGPVSAPAVAPPAAIGNPTGLPDRPVPRVPAADKTLSGFWLRPVLQAANVLRVSSDLSRVTVKRVDPGTKQVRELAFDASVEAQYGGDLWLRDGDVIEVPEKP